MEYCKFKNQWRVFGKRPRIYERTKHIEYKLFCCTTKCLKIVCSDKWVMHIGIQICCMFHISFCNANVSVVVVAVVVVLIDDAPFGNVKNDCMTVCFVSMYCIIIGYFLSFENISALSF